ncbi:hypothetical protein [Natronorubrum bangense]|nr:hypothetical protein [Natronorubrum bangense]
MKVDRDVDTAGQQSTFPKDLEEIIADAIELLVDGVRFQISKVVKE